MGPEFWNFQLLLRTRLCLNQIFIQKTVKDSNYTIYIQSVTKSSKGKENILTKNTVLLSQIL